MSRRYLDRGVSSKKEDVHKAIKNQDKGIFQNTFCKVVPERIKEDLHRLHPLHLCSSHLVGVALAT